MFIIINKETKEIVSIHNQTFDEDVEIEFIYPEFDETTMEFAHGEFDSLPDNFDIVDNKIIPLTLEEAWNLGKTAIHEEDKIVDGELVPKTVEELVGEGVIELSSEEKVENGDIAIKSLREQVADGHVKINEPFEFINEEDQMDYHPLGYLIENGLITTAEQANMALDILNDSLEKEIQSHYSPGHESKLIKGCMEWFAEDKPDGDIRYSNYTEMQSTITKIKDDYRITKSQIKEIIESFGN